jgi:hypothetical protein
VILCDDHRGSRIDPKGGRVHWIELGDIFKKECEKMGKRERGIRGQFAVSSSKTKQRR